MPNKIVAAIYIVLGLICVSVGSVCFFTGYYRSSIFLLFPVALAISYLCRYIQLNARTKFTYWTGCFLKYYLIAAALFLPLSMVMRPKAELTASLVFTPTNAVCLFIVGLPFLLHIMDSSTKANMRLSIRDVKKLRKEGKAMQAITLCDKYLGENPFKNEINKAIGLLAEMSNELDSSGVVRYMAAEYPLPQASVTRLYDKYNDRPCAAMLKELSDNIFKSYHSSDSLAELDRLARLVDSDHRPMISAKIDELSAEVWRSDENAAKEILSNIEADRSAIFIGDQYRKFIELFPDSPRLQSVCDAMIPFFEYDCYCCGKFEYDCEVDDWQSEDQALALLSCYIREVYQHLDDEGIQQMLAQFHKFLEDYPDSASRLDISRHYVEVLMDV